MTQVGEAIAIEVDVAENVQTHDCEWKECKKNHEKSITLSLGRRWRSV